MTESEEEMSRVVLSLLITQNDGKHGHNANEEITIDAHG